LSVAIDGPVASGKTAVGRLVACRLGFRFLDTGLMYRAVTWTALSRGLDPSNEEEMSRLAAALTVRVEPGEGSDRLLVDGQDVSGHLRQPEVEEAVSIVSAVPGVRRAMVREQRAIAGQGPIVMAGRDIGTVVLPQATVKVYMTASVEVRALRRHQEQQAQGKEEAPADVEADLRRRDKIDSQRADSPLRPARDAVQIATDALTVEQAAARIASLARRK
jgi:cytidylate kinase